MKRKKTSLLVLLTMAIAPSVFCQEYYKPNDYYKAINYPTYTISNTPKGDILTGMVFFDVDVFSRDMSVYENWRIDNVVDGNGKRYKSYLSEKDEGNISTNVVVVPKGMFTSHKLVGSEVVVLPSSVKYLKEVNYAFGFSEEEYNWDGYYEYNKKVKGGYTEIEWGNMCLEGPQHPAEFYFNKTYGIKEITKGTVVQPYSGRTNIKEEPLCIHLTGCIGNKATGEVCFIFSVYGNADDDRLRVTQLQAYDEDGVLHNYKHDFYSSDKRQGVRIGQSYGPVEFCMYPFKVPVGTPSFQKLKMSGNTDIPRLNMEFDWKDIPIQWISIQK